MCLLVCVPMCLRVFLCVMYFMCFLCLLWPFCGALVFSDRLCFGEQRISKRSEHLEQQIEFAQTLTPRTQRAEKKLELNASTTISNRQHAGAPLVLTTAARFNFRENIRSVTS